MIPPLRAAILCVIFTCSFSTIIRAGDSRYNRSHRDRIMRVIERTPEYVAITYQYWWDPNTTYFASKRFYYGDIFKSEYISYSTNSQGALMPQAVPIKPFLHEPNDAEPFRQAERLWKSREPSTMWTILQKKVKEITMVAHGFKPIPDEWWHFTLKNEPFPAHLDTSYFNFPVE